MAPRSMVKKKFFIFNQAIYFTIFESFKVYLFIIVARTTSAQCFSKFACGVSNSGLIFEFNFLDIENIAVPLSYSFLIYGFYLV